MVFFSIIFYITGYLLKEKKVKNSRYTKIGLLKNKSTHTSLDDIFPEANYFLIGVHGLMYKIL